MVLQEFSKGSDATAPSTVLLDYRGRPIRTGDYVLLLNVPGYPGVEAGHLGRVVGRRWFDTDGTLNVDVVGSVFEEQYRDGNMSVGRMDTHCVNLNFKPAYLRKISVALIESDRMPRTICVEVDKAAYEIELNPDALRGQHERLKSFRILEEPVGVA